MANNVPRVTNEKDYHQFFNAVKDVLDTLTGKKRNAECDRALLVSDLERLGINIDRFLASTKSGPYGKRLDLVSEVLSSEGYVDLVKPVFDDWQGPLISNQKVNPSSHIVEDPVEASVRFKTTCDLDDYVYMNPQMPHTWKIGTNILPHLHWWQTTAAQPNWLLQYRWQRNGQLKTTVWTYLPITINVFLWTTGTLDQITSSEAVTPPAGYSISDIIQFRVLRDVANVSGEFSGAESSSVDADAMSFDYHHEIDTMGTKTPGTSISTGEGLPYESAWGDTYESPWGDNYEADWT